MNFHLKITDYQAVGVVNIVSSYRHDLLRTAVCGLKIIPLSSSLALS